MQNIYLQALEQQACSRGLNIHFTDIRPGFVDTALLSGDFRYPIHHILLAISDDDTLGIGSDRAARHIDGCPTARGIDSRVGAVETGVVARSTSIVSVIDITSWQSTEVSFCRIVFSMLSSSLFIIKSQLLLRMRRREAVHP